MTVASFTSGDAFTFRVLKHLATNPENVWANSYEFIATDAGGTAELFALGDALVAFERELHSVQVAFDRYIVSTWEADSVPYDPETFVSVPLDVIGVLVSLGNDLVPLGEAWRVNRQAATGRFGNLFFRGSLTEVEVQAPAGKPVLTVPGSQAERLADAIDSSLLANYFGATASGGFYMAMINFNGTQRRVVNQLVSSGVSMIKADHQWFNRTTSGGPGLRAKVARKS